MENEGANNSLTPNFMEVAMRGLIHHFSVAAAFIVALAALGLLPQPVFAQSRIPVRGVASEQPGLAGWNADGGGPEKAATAHTTPCGDTYYSVYYMASRDYGGIDPLSKGENMVGGPSPKLEVEIDWWNHCLDLRPPMKARSGLFFPVDISGSSSAGVQAVAAALMSDVSNLGIKFVFESIQLFGFFLGNGRTGALLEIVSGHIELGGQPTTVGDPPVSTSRYYQLYQNYPNPFHPETEICFQLPEAGHVVVRILNIVGQEIRTLVDAEYEAGFHRVRWDGRDDYGRCVVAGVYIYQLRAGSFSEVKKMSLLRWASCIEQQNCFLLLSLEKLGREECAQRRSELPHRQSGFARRGIARTGVRPRTDIGASTAAKTTMGVPAPRQSTLCRWSSVKPFFYAR